MKLYKNMLIVVDISTGILFFHINMNGLAFYVDSTQSKENKNFLKLNEKKIIFIKRLKYAELKIFCICVDLLKIFEGNDYVKIFEVLSTLEKRI